MGSADANGYINWIQFHAKAGESFTARECRPGASPRTSFADGCSPASRGYAQELRSVAVHVDLPPFRRRLHAVHPARPCRLCVLPAVRAAARQLTAVPNCVCAGAPHPVSDTGGRAVGNTAAAAVVVCRCVRMLRVRATFVCCVRAHQAIGHTEQGTPRYALAFTLCSVGEPSARL